MTADARGSGMTALTARALYAVALIGALGWAWLIVSASAANGTLGFDYRAYDLAVDRLLAGESMYDPTATATGSFGLFFYPPPFALLVLPLALLPVELAVWVWTGILIAASVVAVWILPVSGRVRLAVGLLAALSWPLVYAIKLGQVGPMLLLLFAIGWRWVDRPWALGLSTGIGTVIKLQPAILAVWAAATGRWRAAVIAFGTFAALAVVATGAAGPQSWLDEAALLGRVSRPIETEHAFGIGRLAFEAGLSLDAATVVHWVNLGLVVAVVGLLTLRAMRLGASGAGAGAAVDADHRSGVALMASFMAVMIATQFLSPVLWDHYALILLLPVAWLLARGRWWAAVIPLLTSTPLLALPTPGSVWVYPIVFWASLLAVAWEGWRASESGPGRP